ncbi:flavodoxin [Levilactobacillus brevis]|uniref:flavodoxin n=1 Tax=Levilactobacillus brevis TaxID=1580 RepID=UPI00117BA335|nr:flavodoxin [Levilactobacillus brevis]
MVNTILKEADLFFGLILQSTDYPDEYQQVLKITKHELDERTFPKIMPITADIAGSNHIILAFPNWWNHLPRPIVTFMEQYQWQDKTIYPVCTHEGNRFGDSLNELSEIA